MNRNEFIQELRKALENDGNEAAVRENVRYYTEYIEGEMKKGRSEREVIDELGDPWLIAKTISTTPGGRESYQSYDNVDENYVHSRREEKERDTRMHTFHLDGKWKLILLLVAVIVILVVILSIIGGIISFLMPVIGPLLVIIIVVKLLSGKKK